MTVTQLNVLILYCHNKYSLQYTKTSWIQLDWMRFVDLLLMIGQPLLFVD